MELLSVRRWSFVFLASGLMILLIIYFVERNRYNQITENLEQASMQESNQDETKQKDQPSSVLNEYAVAADHQVAVDIGLAVLDNGGNAVDAGVAVAYALSVLEPDASGLGGGGLMLVHSPGDKKPVLYDYREVAPSTPAKRDSSIGVPGFVKGMEIIHNEYGSMDLKQLIQPAVVLAENGMKVTKHLNERLQAAAYRMPVSQLDNFYPNGNAIQTGRLLKQEDLARTLRKIQKKGSSVFYTGEIGEAITKELGISKEDLKEYQVEMPDPLEIEFADFQVFAPSPPSGGLMMLQALQLAERLELWRTKGKPAEHMHMVTEVIKRAYKTRLENVGDPRFEDVPVEELLSSDFLKDLAEDIDEDEVTKEYLSKLDTQADRNEEGDTTHFVIVDADGMMVSSTNTLSNFFGSGVNVAGVFFNNQLDNFSSDSNSPNAREPGKRPHSYTTPLIFTKEEKPVIGIGAAGGRRIPSTLLQVILRMHFFDENLDTSINHERFFGQVNENTLSLEERQSNEVEDTLQDLGYDLDYGHSSTYFGAVQMLWIDYEHGVVRGAADKRRNGNWEVEPIDVNKTK